MSDISDDEENYFGEEYDMKMKHSIEDTSDTQLKKVKQNEVDDIGFVEPFENPNREMESLNVSTYDIKQFCTVISGFKSIPNIEIILFMFTKDGMAIYGKPSASPAFVLSFWNKDHFQSNNCTKDVRKWISIKRCEELTKNITKNVDVLNIRNIVGDEPGLVFSGRKSEENGKYSPFEFNIYEFEEDINIVDMSQKVYNCQIMTSSKTMQTSIDFIAESSEFINFQLENNKIIFTGFQDTGRKGEVVSQDIFCDEGSSDGTKDIKYSCILLKTYLNIVKATKSLSPDLNIHLQVDTSENEQTLPLLFRYMLDTNSPPSYLSIYLMPKAHL
jgi:hypothetical protein